MKFVNHRVLCLNPGAVTPLFHEQGSCLKLTFYNDMLSSVYRLTYDCPTVTVRYPEMFEHGHHCLMPSVYPDQRAMLASGFEQLGIEEYRPINAKAEQVYADSWYAGAEELVAVGQGFRKSFIAIRDSIKK